MRSEYVLANLQEINSLVADIYVQVTLINYSVKSAAPPREANKQRAHEDIAKMNWKLIETASMMDNSRDIQTLQRFQRELNQVGTALDGKLDIAGCQKLLVEVNEMAYQAALVIQAVGRRVDLGGEFTPTKSNSATR